MVTDDGPGGILKFRPGGSYYLDSISDINITVYPRMFNPKCYLFTLWLRSILYSLGAQRFFTNLHLARTFFNVYCLAQTFFFATQVYWAENCSSAPIYSTG